MGISDFLSRVLESAGQVCDLQCYADGILEPVENTHKRRRRPMRIGIDVSSWVYNAAHGYGDMLGDERHLSNYGRAALYDEQQQRNLNNNSDPVASLNPSEETIRAYVQTCTKYVLTRMEFLRDTTKADILVVLDGASPPIKTREVERRRSLRREQERVRDQPVDPNECPTKNNIRRTKAFRRAGAGRYHGRIIDELLQGLRQAGLPFLVAPYEADGELAYLSDMGFIDLVVTEDSDLVAHGAKAILYKSISEIANNNPKGKLLKFSDIGSVEDANFCLTDFTPVMMTILFVSVGCDYCDKLKGVGLLTASRVIREAFCSPNQPTHHRISHRQNHQRLSKLARVFEQLYLCCYMSSSALTPEFKQAYEDRFLSAIFMYRHPIVYDPLQENNVLTSRCLHEDNNVGGGVATMVSMNGQEEDEAIDPVQLFVDDELIDHEPYVELCRDFERIQNIVGRLCPKAEAARAAQGFNRKTEAPDEETKNDGEPKQAANEGNVSATLQTTGSGTREESVAETGASQQLQFQDELSSHHDKENSGTMAGRKDTKGTGSFQDSSPRREAEFDERQLFDTQEEGAVQRDRESSSMPTSRKAPSQNDSPQADEHDSSPKEKVLDTQPFFPIDPIEAATPNSQSGEHDISPEVHALNTQPFSPNDHIEARRLAHDFLQAHEGYVSHNPMDGREEVGGSGAIDTITSPATHKSSSQTTGMSSSTKSPLLLYSTTPEEKAGISQESANTASTSKPSGPMTQPQV